MRYDSSWLFVFCLSGSALALSCSSDPSSPSESSAGSSGSGGSSSGGSGSPTAGSATSGSGGTTSTAGAGSGGGGTSGGGALPELAADRLAAADRFACAINASNSVVCWGFDADWTETEPRNSMQKSVTAGGQSRCSVDAAGVVFCRGDLANVPIPARSFVEVVVSSDDHACGRGEDGTVDCWARSGATEWTVPTGNFAQLAAGDGFACGIRPSGGVECWGPFAPSPVPASTPKRLFARADQACVIQSDDTVSCWGDGPSVTNDVTVRSLAMGKSMGGAYVCGLKLDGIVVCWGDEPSVVGQGPKVPFVAITGGSEFACGILPSGKLQCWGSLSMDVPADFSAF
jgi:hypothetical protein